MSKISEFEPRPIPNVAPEGAMTQLTHWKKKTSAPPAKSAAGSVGRRRRIACYLRYSTDKQDEYSFDRQLNRAREYAASIGGDIVRVYGDPGESGYFSCNRPEFLEMLADAENGEFDTLLIENADRIARRVHITTSAFAKLSDHGIELHSAGEGKWTLLHAALFGAMSEEQRNRLAELIRSGIVKLITKKLWPGRAPYAFEKIKGQPGEMRIVEEKAEVVRRAFRMRRSGISPFSIAEVFEEEKIEAPGQQWCGETVNYILQNPIYIGLGIYCRTRQQRKEADGRMKYCSTSLPVEKWIYVERSDWRVLRDLDDWYEVQKLIEANRGKFGPTRHYLLSRLMFCGECGGPMAACGNYKHRTKVKCATNKNMNRMRKKFVPCGQREVTLQSLEEAVIDLVCQKLDKPNALARMQAGYASKIEEDEKNHNRQRLKLEADRKKIYERLDALDEAAMVSGLTTKVVAEKRRDHCRRIDEIDNELASIPRVALSGRFVLAPADSAEYLEQLLPGRCYRDCSQEVAKLAATFRRLVGRVVVLTDPQSDRVTVTLEGLIANVDGEAIKEFVPAPRIAARCRDANTLARGGAFRIPDGDWEAVARDLPFEAIWLDELDRPLHVKHVVEAVIFTKHTRLGSPNLTPDVWPQRIHVWAAARMMSYAGVLDVIEEKMRNTGTKLVDGITLSLEANRSKKPNSIVRFVEWNDRRRARVLNTLKPLPKGATA